MRKFHIGAGTLITVFLALAIGGYSVYRQHRIAAQPPMVERIVHGSTGAGITPAPEFLLRHRLELALSAAQLERIQHIATAYRHEIAPLQQQATAVSADYRQQVEQTHQGKRPSLQDLQHAGGELTHLSSVLVTTRQSYWRQACAVLSTEQQGQADRLVTRATLEELQ